MNQQKEDFIIGETCTHCGAYVDLAECDTDNQGICAGQSGAE